VKSSNSKLDIATSTINSSIDQPPPIYTQPLHPSTENDY